jgi:hypothetical protein
VEHQAILLIVLTALLLMLFSAVRSRLPRQHVPISQSDLDCERPAHRPTLRGNCSVSSSSLQR